MHGYSLGHSNPDGGNFALWTAMIGRNPHPASPRNLKGGKTDIGARADQNLLQAANMINNGEGFREVNNGVTHQLAGAVPRDASTAINIYNGGPVGG
jgi:hypothetical protein